MGGYKFVISCWLSYTYVKMYLRYFFGEDCIFFEKSMILAILFDLFLENCVMAPLFQAYT